MLQIECYNITISFATLQKLCSNLPLKLGRLLQSFCNVAKEIAILQCCSKVAIRFGAVRDMIAVNPLPVNAVIQSR